MSIKGYAAEEPKKELVPFSYNSKPLGPWDVEIRITHCGICHSDIHLIDNDWQVSKYPFIPGHEIVGEVVNKGGLIQELHRGDRVGVGWQRSSCMRCSLCTEGEENLCALQEETCVNNHGGYADHIVIDGRFAFKIPEEIPSEKAGPLMCGGATVFSPMIQHKITGLHKVAVIGIGGLGHLAIQFASALGCEVTAISSSPQKEEEAKSFGATHFTSLDKAKKNHFDFILCTATENLDWQKILELLYPKGILCTVGSVSGKIEAPNFPFISHRLSFTGSNIASRKDIIKMLAFAARHNIEPMVELFPLAQVNEAIQKLRDNKIHYRAVLQIS